MVVVPEGFLESKEHARVFESLPIADKIQDDHVEAETLPMEFLLC